jgi:hypothetical protein
MFEVNKPYHHQPKEIPPVSRRFDPNVQGQWYHLPLQERQQIVDSLHADPTALLQLAKEIEVNTGTTTQFGRHADILEAARYVLGELSQENRMELLDIGPGMSMPGIVELALHYKLPLSQPELVRPYIFEPIELLALFQRLGYSNLHLDVLEIDPLVAEMLKVQKDLVLELRYQDLQFYYNGVIAQLDPAARSVLQDELKEVNARILVDEEKCLACHHLRIPQPFLDALSVKQGDIQVAVLPTNFYDFISFFAVDIYVKDKDQALWNAVTALKVGGFLMTNKIPDPTAYGLVERVRAEWHNPKICYQKYEDLRK